MKKRKNNLENSLIRRVTLSGTIALIALLLSFLVVTLFTTSNLTSQIRLLTEHPFTVNGDISDVKTNLALMRIRTERLQAYNQPSDILTVQNALDVLYVDMEELLAEIEELYLGPASDVTTLKETYESIKKEHHLFLEFSRLSSSTTDVIAEYETVHLYPLYDQFQDNAETILTYVRGTQQNIFSAAEKMGHSTIIWSCTIIAATTVALLFFQYIIRRISTSLYQKNRQFELLSETIDETFLIIDKNTKHCDFVSGNSDRVLGIAPDVLRKNPLAIRENLSTDTVNDLKKNLLTAGKTSGDALIEYHRPEAVHPKWLQLRFYRIGENSDTKYIVTFLDRTEERRSHKALEDALINTENANNAKKDFMSRMSHEIRTPMNAIIGMTTIAAASINDRMKVEDCLRKISYSSKHLLMLINDVLDISRIESNRMHINAEPFELFQFINTFVSVVYPQAVTKGLKFKEKITGFSENTTFLGDSLRLNQILLNLVSNGLKFTPSGGEIRLQVTPLPSRGTKSWLRFQVSDTGIGMDEQGLSHLYKPFEQADETIARKYGGTGLGMSITHNLVTLMGGYINVESSPGEGTTFTVDLPFEQSKVNLPPLLEGTLEELEVLVVDDEQDICEHAVLLLQQMNIHAKWVLSGREAVEQVVTAHNNGQGFDVCFIDWKMPDMNGIETARRIRKEVGPGTPIIIISAYDWTEIEREAREAGVTAFISKPMFQSSIYNALINVTNRAFLRPEIPPGGNNDQSLSGKCLLLAEDNPLNTEIAVTLLEMNGAAVEAVENGQEAVELFLRMEPGHFDAILMDVQMPVIDGCEATRQIRGCGRADAKDIPIIATTANAFAEDVSTVMAAGMNAHLGKPLDITQLCTILNKLCGTDKH